MPKIRNHHRNGARQLSGWRWRRGGTGGWLAAVAGQLSAGVAVVNQWRRNDVMR